MLPCMIEQDLDLRQVSSCHMRQSGHAAYRVVSQPVHCLCRRAHNLGNGWEGALSAAGSAVALAVHLAGWRGTRGGGKGAAALFTALYAPGSSRMSDARSGGG